MEPAILYFVLFFPGVYASGFMPDITANGTIPFSAIRELGRTVTYIIPSLALLWYLILGRPSDGTQFIKMGWASFSLLKKPQKPDIISLLIGFPGLILIGFALSTLISLFSHNEGLAPPLKVEAPHDIFGWIVMVISCLGTGYLEESYFRYYLLSKLENQLSKPIVRIVISTILFSLCHIYEGPWGIINSFLAGFFLSMLYIRYKSLNGIALTHGLYNIFVYAIGIYNS